MSGDHRKEFEIAVLFRGDLHEGRAGFLLKKKDGTYENSRAELLYQGFALGISSELARLDRYNPERFIGAGHMNELDAVLREDGHSIVPKAAVRVILRIVGSWPT